MKFHLSRLTWRRGNSAPEARRICALTERRVTDRRRHISDFRYRDFRLGAIAQTAEFGIYDLDYTTGDNYWSPELKEIVGASKNWDDFSLDQLVKAVHPEDRDRLLRKMEASLDPLGNGQFEDECRLVRGNGHLCWIKIRSRTFFASPGAEPGILGVSGLLADISDRKAAEKALREQSEELRLALRVGSSGTFQWDARTHEHRWCQEMLTLYGLKPENFGGRDEDWLSCLLPEDRDQAWAAVDRSLKTGEYAAKFRIRRRNDGEVRWVIGRGQVSFDGSGNPVRMVGINVDITEQREIEEELRIFQFFSDHSNDGHVLMDQGSRIRYVNRLVCEREGYGKEEMLQLSLGDLNPEMTMERFREVFERGKSGRIEPFETVHRRRDGSIFPVEVSATVLEFKGEWLMFAASRDITERKATEAQIQALNAELESRVQRRTAELQRANESLLQMNMDLKHFAHATAHDLQTPLRSIAGFAQLLHQEIEGRDGRVEEYSTLVVENTKRLQMLIQELLSYTRLEVQGRPLKTADLGSLADEAVASLAQLIGETGAEVTRGDLPALRVDRTQIAQVLQNLIENGIKYNRSRPPRISIGAELQENDWVFSVADNGIGIDPRHHERIFEIFRRLHTYHQVPGTGIGLALCRRIVERHGGHMWVESRPGEGSTFYFTLPNSP